LAQVAQVEFLQVVQLQLLLHQELTQYFQALLLLEVVQVAVVQVAVELSL
jgi:hypothetical protein